MNEYLLFLFIVIVAFVILALQQPVLSGNKSQSILDIKYSFRQVKRNIEMFLLYILLIIALILACILISAYAGMIAGYDHVSNQAMSNYSQESVLVAEFHEHRNDMW